MTTTKHEDTRMDTTGLPTDSRTASATEKASTPEPWEAHFGEPTNEKAPAHTPGPWTLDESHEIDDGLYVRAHGRRDYVCAMGAAVWDASEGCGMLTSEDVANGSLIAAAPELLAACRRSLDWLASYPGGGGMSAYDQMRAAIAKAEGK